jgi:pyruvate formate lyase activating enzyme
MKREAMLYEKQKDNSVQCILCAHRCRISDGKFGICGVRENNAGVLYTHVYGNPITMHVDPIEKKPLYHFLPGTRAYSIATIGCNFKCGFCQNWQISQVNAKAIDTGAEETVTAADVAAQAKRTNCKSIAYTYTEPTIFFEYAYDCSKKAVQHSLKNVFVTNGFMTKEALDTIKPYLHAANVDLKSFSDDYYKKVCKGRLQPVLDGIRLMKEYGIWLEVTTLLVPEENDSEEEITAIADFIAETGTDIPWHISRFFPTYEYNNHRPTSVDTMRAAEDIGKKKGIKNIHLGNV